jgi:hypothetical protein
MTALLKLVALGASIVILLSFLAFASDQTSEGRDAQVAKVDRQVAPGSQVERLREEKHGSVRETIDDANDFLLIPFANIIESNSLWAHRVIAGLLGLLLYGLGLSLVANYIQPRRPRPGGSFSEPPPDFVPYR